jgi:ATP-dependent helicase HrpB
MDLPSVEYTLRRTGIMREPLPIDQVLPQLVEALRADGGVVLQAPTGAGKTTRVPVALLQAGLAGERQIVMLEPRRIAARAAARRMAAELGIELGREVGFQVRFERCAGPDTRILVVTEGVLLRMLHDDPFLETVGIVVFDEFHERSLDVDLGLGMTRLLRRTVRPDLRVVVMSATLAGESVARYLDNCPLVTSEGRLFPVDIEYMAREARQPWPEVITRALWRLLPRTPGDVLVFLPGVGEIHQTARHLADLARREQFDIAPLYGDLPADQQDAVLNPGPRRRVILATNVAETSVTVPGVTGVIDTGQARILAFDPAVGLDRLELAAISQASADQRAGRAGRLQPGHCVRLWSGSQHGARPAHNEPEVRRVDLAGAVLQLHSLGESDILAFPWFEPPRAAAARKATELLEQIGALRDGQLTPTGRLLARLPVHPRIGRLLLEGHNAHCLDRIALAAALLSERDPFRSGPSGDSTGAGGRGAGSRNAGGANGAFGRGATGPVGPTRASTRSDLLERVEAIEEHLDSGRADFPFGSLSRGAVRSIVQARDQLARLVRSALRRSHLGPPPTAPQSTSGSRDESFLRAVFAAFPDRLACRREPHSPRALMTGGRGVRLDPASGVHQAELFVCVSLDAGQGESRVRIASSVERDWLPRDGFTTAIDVVFEEATGRLSARRRVRYADLVLEESPAALPSGEAAAEALAAAAATRLPQVLPAADSDAGKFLARVRCLREWMPELELPPLGDSDLVPLLPWVCAGCRSLAEVRDADWQSAIASLLTPAQQQAVRREAPERIAVPSGSHIALVYEQGRPPVLAVRIQEVFGLRDTPRIAGGRVRVLMHLLGPNYRPQQVTDDLASFWGYAYLEIRKELRRRYPKHAWPDDPATATPESRPKRR